MENINWQNLIYITPIGFIGCLILNYLIIEPVNNWWEKKHPTKPRHPFSPAFTAVGTVMVVWLSAYLIPWQHSLIVLAGFFLFGGTMWILHQIRWKRRNHEPGNSRRER